MGLPDFSYFKRADRDTQARLLELLFEQSSSLELITVDDPHFVNDIGSDYTTLVETVRSKLMGLCSRGQDPDTRHHLSDIIAAHPKLGQPKQNLSAHSAMEQRNLGSSDSTETLEVLQALNNSYEEKYPGLRFVVFVNGRPRSEIIEVMQRRINSGNSWLHEAQLACNEMCNIALDRVKKDSSAKPHKL
ncbi:LANO_0E02278g1_1 [Lachancea nothofagi CBS 11611]|uniref:LANO_0E02278g1_1 n=1 Tax=Lachancea nothofagi CBS 11611 TaxID=1266666 RepID=A0A1G4JQE0_9SACH|nr:LANO_0E02278g1_1 [Lachancea nothofagi CBS 11611]